MTTKTSHHATGNRRLRAHNVLLAFLLVVLFTGQVTAQYFNVNGDASDNGSGCYELTPFAKQKSGSIWTPNKVSLLNSFTVTGKMNFGTNFWSGADGLAFALQPVFNTNTGTGAGLGVGYVTPSVVVEFDTYKNGHDPNYDHIAILRDGNPSHTGAPAYTLANPVRISGGTTNVKNGNWYDYKITWDAASQTLAVYINCDLRISYSGNIINGIFGGDPNVYWGFSSATGDKYNRHQVCIDASDLFKIEDEAMCAGEEVTINLPTVGTNYSLGSWTPTTGIVDANAPNPKFSPSTTTEYIVSYEGTCGEEVRDTFEIKVENAPSVSLGNDTSVCVGNNLTLDAGNPGSTYEWSTGATSQTIAASTGHVHVAVTNPTGCIGRDSIDISSSSGLNFSLGNDTSLCGAINLTLDPKVSGASYTWNTGATSQSIAASSAGTYWVEVNAGGCTGRDSIVISASSGLNLDIGNDTTLCTGDNFTVNSNQTGVTHLWNDGSKNNSISISAPGNYYLDITDASGCSGSDTIVVSGGNTIPYSLGNDTSICQGSSLTLSTGVSNASYLWNDGSTSPTLIAGVANSYDVLVQKQGFCDTRDTIQVNISTGITLSLGNDTSICTGSSLTLDAQNTGATYLWNDGSTQQQLNTSSAGWYWVQVQPSGDNCSYIDSLELSIAAKLDIQLGNDTTICGPINLTVDATTTGGSYLWNNASTNPTISIKNAGTYFVDVSSSAGCSGSDTIVVSSAPSLSVDLGNDTSVCGTINLALDAGNAGANFLWSDGSSAQVLTVSSAGTYFVDVSSGGCSARDSMLVSGGTSLSIDLGSDQQICGNSITLDASHASANGYLWNTGASSASIDVNTAGTYDVVATDANGCEGRDTVLITTGVGGTLNLGNDTSLCEGSSHTLDAENKGAIFLWNTGDQSQYLSVTKTGTYEVTVTTSAGCELKDTIVITMVTAPNISLPADTTLCDGQNLTLSTGNSNDVHSWSSGELSHSIAVSTPGTYDVTVTNTEGCSSTERTEVTLETIDINLDNNFYRCEEEYTTLAVTAMKTDYSYNWDNTGQSSLTTNTDGWHYVVVQSNKGCSKTDSTELIAITPPSIDIVSDSVACEGEPLTIQVSSNGNIQWDQGATTEQLTVYYSGTYGVTATTSQNNISCSVRDSIVTRFIEAPDYREAKIVKNCFDQIAEATIRSNINGSTYDWGRGIVGPSQTHTISEAGTYLVSVYNEKQCPTEQEILVEDVCPTTIFVPNSFTPNGDGLNDLLRFYVNNSTDVEFFIYNRWGEEVFKSTNPSDTWDGTVNGKAVQSDVYVWKAKLEGYNGSLYLTQQNHTGTITIVR